MTSRSPFFIPKRLEMEKAYVLYGPPGTGKTTELMARAEEAAKLIQKHEIGFVSFTKAAAAELAHRLGVKPGGNISTVHSMAFRMAGIIRDQVINYSKLKEFQKLTGIEMTGGNPDDAEYTTDGDKYLAALYLHRARLDPDLDTTYHEAGVEGTLYGFKYFVDIYENFKKVHGYVDFADMLEKALNCEGPNVKVLFVDEGQDLSPQQWRLIEHWAQSIPVVHVAGDDDQAIYKWGGADPQGMFKFERKYNAERKILAQSYRIPSSVHKMAETLIDSVVDRVEKKYSPRDEVGEVKTYNSPQMLKFEHGEDCMVLHRNHFMRKDIEEVLLDQHVPYEIIGGRPGHLQLPSANAARMWKKTQIDFANEGRIFLTTAQMKMIAKYANTKFKLQIERGDIMPLLTRNWDEIIYGSWEMKQYLRAVDKLYGLEVKPTIRMSSIHGSKGREADRIVLLNGMTDKTAQSLTGDYDSEARTFYVAITRTRHKLDIVMAGNPMPNLRVR